ncbi:MAG: hypothetical protein AB1757_13510 [Acidobacteriota bacterium]
MSRLDDELKLMFRREQPSADFTARVMARLAEQAPKPSLWQRLIGLFQMPVMRWAMAGAAILLVAGIVFVQYQRDRANDVSTGTANVNRPAGSKTDNRNLQGETAGGNENGNRGGEQKNDKVFAPPKIAPKPFAPERRIVAVEHKRKAAPHKVENDLPEGQVAKAHDASQRSPNMTMSERERGEQAKEQLFKALEIASNLLAEARKVAIGGK